MPKIPTKYRSEREKRGSPPPPSAPRSSSLPATILSPSPATVPTYDGNPATLKEALTHLFYKLGSLAGYDQPTEAELVQMAYLYDPNKPYLRLYGATIREEDLPF